VATVDDLGTASLGFPLNGGAVAGTRLVVSSRNLVPPRLATVDLDTREVTAGPQVPTGNGAWALAAIDPQRVVLGMSGARGADVVYRYDLAAGTVTPLARLDVDFVWALEVEGTTAYGIGLPSVVFAVDIETGALRTLGLVDPATETVRAFTRSGDQLVVGGVRANRAFLVAGVEGGAPRSVLPSALEAHELVYTAAAGPGLVAAGTQGPGSQGAAVALLDGASLAPVAVATLPAEEGTVDTVAVGPDAVWATARPSGALYRIDRVTGAAQRTAVPIPGSETRALAVRGDAVVGVGAAQRIWIARGGDVALVDLLDGGVQPGPEQSQSLSVAGGTAAVGGNFGLQVHRTADAATRRWFVPGEPKDQVVAGPTRHLAIYPVAQIWSAGLGLDDEPRLTAQLPVEQNRPVCLAHDAATDLLLCGTASDRRGGGALHLVTPGSGAVESFVDVIAPGEFVSRIAVADGTAYLAGGAASPALVEWDVRARAERWRVAPIAEAIGTVTGLVVLGRRAHVLTQEGFYAVVDLDARRTLSSTRIGADGGGRMLAFADRLTAVDRRALFDIAPATGARTDVVTGLDPVVFGNPFLAIGDDGLRYTIRSTSLVRVRDDDPPPPPPPARRAPGRAARAKDLLRRLLGRG